nr:uncharacterized protein LOC115266778 [Aedes albopictus]
MSSYRKNTQVVDFSVLPKRVPADQVEEFLKHYVKIDMADVRSIQLHSLKNCVYIEMHNAGVPPRMAKQHNLQHSIKYKESCYYIPIYVDGPTTTIRIHDLSPQMSNSIISDYLAQYGDVISVSNEVWKHYFVGLPNGVRVVRCLRVKMKKPVPAHITIDNQLSLVTYAKGEKHASLHERDEQKQCQKQASRSDVLEPQCSASIHTNQNDDQPTAPNETDDDDDDDPSPSNSAPNRLGGTKPTSNGSLFFTTRQVVQAPFFFISPNLPPLHLLLPLLLLQQQVGPLEDDEGDP